MREKMVSRLQCVRYVIETFSKNLFTEWPLTLQPIADVLTQVWMCASIFMMVAITMERHFAICSPHQYRIHLILTPKWKHLVRYVGPAIMASFLFNIPAFFNMEVCNIIFSFLSLFRAKRTKMQVSESSKFGMFEVQPNTRYI